MPSETLNCPHGTADFSQSLETHAVLGSIDLILAGIELEFIGLNLSASLNLQLSTSSLPPHSHPVEALRAAGGGGCVEEMEGFAVAGNVGAEGDPDATDEVGAAFHGVGAAGDGGEFERDIGAAGAPRAETQGTGGIERVGASKGFFGIGETVAVAVDWRSLGQWIGFDGRRCCYR